MMCLEALTPSEPFDGWGEERLKGTKTILEAGQTAESVWILFGTYRPGLRFHFSQEFSQSGQFCWYTLHRKTK